MANTKKQKEVTVESVLNDFYTLNLVDQVKVKGGVQKHLDAKAEEAQKHLDLLLNEK